MRNFSFIILVCLLAASCGTARSVSQEKAAVSTVESVDSSSLRQLVEKMVQEQMAVALQMEMSEQLEVVHEVFDAPDSTGNATLVERTTSRYSSSSISKASSDINRRDSTVTVVAKDSTSHIDASTDIKESVVDTPARIERRTPWLVRTLAWIGGFALLALLIWVLRKFRVI